MEQVFFLPDIVDEKIKDYKNYDKETKKYAQQNGAELKITLIEGMIWHVERKKNTEADPSCLRKPNGDRQQSWAWGCEEEIDLNWTEGEEFNMDGQEMYGMVCYSMLWYGLIQYALVWFDTVCFGMV